MSYNLLKGKKGIIFGVLDEHSIAWKIAKRAYEEGASLILTNSPVALRMGKVQELAKKVDAPVMGADATSMENLAKLFAFSKDHFEGKTDFILHSIGMSANVRKKRHYAELDYEDLRKGWDVSAISFHKIMRSAWDNKMINEWGSIVALTYIAAQRVFPDYSDMADHKACLESIARSFGYHFAKKYNVRVNTVSQSPTPTTAGNGIKGFDSFLNYAERLSPLGNASGEDCANYVISLFSDLTKKVTMQNLFHDGGFSTTGISEEMMGKFEEE